MTDDKNIYCGDQPLARIITDRLYNIHLDESSNYFREETTKNKEEQPLVSLQSDNQSKEDQLKDPAKLKSYVNYVIQWKRWHKFLT